MNPVRFGFPVVQECPVCTGDLVCGSAADTRNILFELGSGKAESPPFTITDAPAIIKGFQLSEHASAQLEMQGGCAGQEFSELVVINGQPYPPLTSTSNIMVVNIPGRFRLVWDDPERSDGYVEIDYASIPFATVVKSLVSLG